MKKLFITPESKMRVQSGKLSVTISFNLAVAPHRQDIVDECAHRSHCPNSWFQKGEPYILIQSILLIYTFNSVAMHCMLSVLCSDFYLAPVAPRIP